MAVLDLDELLVPHAEGVTTAQVMNDCMVMLFWTCISLLPAGPHRYHRRRTGTGTGPELGHLSVPEQLLHPA